MAQAKKTETQKRQEVKETRKREFRRRTKLIERAKAGDKDAARKLAEQYRITKVYSQKEIDSRS